MPIKIYTYSDPYNIHRESFWNEIKNCPHFCVSQTMVNGLEEVYPSLRDYNELTTIRILVNALYRNWEDINTHVKQIMEVDSIINSLKINSNNSENIKRSLEFNTKSIVSCIRLFNELNINHKDIDVTELNREQKLLVEIFKKTRELNYSSFRFKHIQEQELIEKSIESALKKKYKEIDFSRLNMDTIVIHGVHQFSPAMLCAIQDISVYKNVVLLFNYQEQYKGIYQTWLNVYSLFDSKIITKNDNQFKPIPLLTNSYSSNVFADSIGRLANGEIVLSNKALEQIEVIEFENITEFAGYTASLFEKAKKIHSGSNGKRAVISFMPDQMYSTSSRINDILRSYFPEQFGERHFLDYPIGHFFVAITNMWNPTELKVKVDNLSDIKECLSSGIISESKHGILLNTFNRIESFIEKETTLQGIIKQVKKLRKIVSPDVEKEKRIGYFEPEKDNINELYKALQDLNEIIESFFSDFNDGDDNFQRFYKKIHDFIIRKVDDMNELDEEMREVISRLLERIKNTDLPETGTFNCLKQTMSFYLSQDDSLVKGANWIVRNFEQIDGDILRSAKQNAENTCYHFCCLSDKDMCSDKNERLPWPLDIKFFEYCYEPLDWKYQIFLKSKMEFKNFKRYALLYGLEFNRVGCKLSYVKTENRKDNDLYHLISLLGIKVKKYHNENQDNYLPHLKYTSNDKIDDYYFDTADTIRFNICPYRFALETVVQGYSIFRDRFLILHYMRILLVNEVQKKLAGMKFDDSVLRKKLNEVYDELDSKFRTATELEKTEIISSAYNSMCNDNYNYPSFKSITQNTKESMQLSEEFLFTELNKIDRKNIDDKLLAHINDSKPYNLRYGKHCMYCASKDICLHAKKE